VVLLVDNNCSARGLDVHRSDQLSTRPRTRWTTRRRVEQ